MEVIIYRSVLFLTGVANLILAFQLWSHNRKFAAYPVYVRARICTMIWVTVFALGYWIHALTMWRFTWPTGATALSTSYFHVGAICFSWGYTALLNPNYLTRRIVWRDIIIYLVGLTSYWSAACNWHYSCFFTKLSLSIFFIYAALVTFTFYHTYNRVSFRLMKMSLGSVSGFVHWLQVCCDFIVLFGISSVIITAVFPYEIWPYTLLLVSGVVLYSYIVYSIHQYGSVIETADNLIDYKS